MSPLLPAHPAELTSHHIDAMFASGLVGDRPLWNGLFRAIVLDADDYRCRFCHRSGFNTLRVPNCEQSLAIRLELDHLIPRANGGTNTLENIRTACRICNAGRSRMCEDQFRAELQSIVASLAAAAREAR